MKLFRKKITDNFYRYYDFCTLKIKSIFSCFLTHSKKTINRIKAYNKLKKHRNKLLYRNYFTQEYNAAINSNNPIYNFVLDQLNCVDSKSSSLLTYNGLVITFTACLIGFQLIYKLLPLLLEVILWINIFILLISSLLCLFCIDIFSPHILKKDYTTNDYIEKVTSIAAKRTMWYRNALRITQISAILFSVFFILIFILFFPKK